MVEKYSYVVCALGSADFMKKKVKESALQRTSVPNRKESFLDKLVGMLLLFL